MAARGILDHIGMSFRGNNEIIGKVFKIGNNLSLPEPLDDTLLGIEEDVFDDTGIAVRCLMDLEDCGNPAGYAVCRLLREPHIDGLIGILVVFPKPA
ncbi:MAG: hypothetical protein R3E93_01805 [Thiothrix sp.]